MAERKIQSMADAAEQGRRRGQKTRAELLEETEALKKQVAFWKGCADEMENQCWIAVDRVESLLASRDAWIRKCEELTGRLEAKRNYAFELHEHNHWLEAHPWRNLWRYLKERLHLGK